MCSFDKKFFERYSSDVAVKGLLIAIGLSTNWKLHIGYHTEEDEKNFKDLFPALVAAAGKGGTKLGLSDYGLESLNEFAANVIEKAGAHVEFLNLYESVNLCRLLANVKKV